MTADNVMSIVFGAHTAAGLVMLNTGVVLMATTTGSISVQVPNVLLI